MALNAIPTGQCTRLHAAVLAALEDDLQASTLAAETKRPIVGAGGGAPVRRRASFSLPLPRATNGSPHGAAPTLPDDAERSFAERGDPGAPRNAHVLPPSYALLGHHARLAGEPIKAAAYYLASAKQSTLDLCLRHGLVRGGRRAFLV